MAAKSSVPNASTLTSLVPGADDSGVSLADLPYGVAEVGDGDFRVCVAIGGSAFDLAGSARRGLLD